MTAQQQPVGSLTYETQALVARRFIAFVAYEIKSGYLCQGVRSDIPHPKVRSNAADVLVMKTLKQSIVLPHENSGPSIKQMLHMMRNEPCTASKKPRTKFIKFMYRSKGGRATSLNHSRASNGGQFTPALFLSITRISNAALDDITYTPPVKVFRHSLRSERSPKRCEIWRIDRIHISSCSSHQRSVNLRLSTMASYKGSRTTHSLTFV